MYRGSLFAAYANEHFQGNNFSDDLLTRGLPGQNTIKQQHDLNPSFGGPLVPDCLWVFGSGRYLYTSNYARGIPYNLNARLPGAIREALSMHPYRLPDSGCADAVEPVVGRRHAPDLAGCAQAQAVARREQPVCPPAEYVFRHLVQWGHPFAGSRRR